MPSYSIRITMGRTHVWIHVQAISSIEACAEAVRLAAERFPEAASRYSPFASEWREL